MSAVRWIDETDFGFGWIHPEPAWMQRAGHAFLAGGGVWVVDPPDGDGVLERIRALGEPAGVLQLLDRHPRDGAALASELGVPLHVLPFGGVAGAPWTAIGLVRLPVWKEIAVWVGEHRALYVVESLAAGPGYSAPTERVGLHLARRALPPQELRTLDAEHLMLGHGEGLHGHEQIHAAVRDAFDGARVRIPALLLGQARAVLPF